MHVAANVALAATEVGLVAGSVQVLGARQKQRAPPASACPALCPARVVPCCQCRHAAAEQFSPTRFAPGNTAAAARLFCTVKAMVRPIPCPTAR